MEILLFVMSGVAVLWTAHTAIKESDWTMIVLSAFVAATMAARLAEPAVQ